MHNLLLHLFGSPTFNATMFPPHLYIYDDMLMYKKRGIIKVREVSIAYSHVSQVSVIKGLFFSQIEIRTIGSEVILIRYISKKIAEQAKKIIDQKVFYSIAKHSTSVREEDKSLNIAKVERALLRYKELLNRGVISKSQFEKKTNELIRKSVI